MPGSRARGVGLALVTAVVWGTIPIAGKFALAAVTPAFLSFVRFTVAGTLMLGAVAWTGRSPVDTLRDPPLKLVAVAAVGLTGNYLLYFAGLELTTATAAQIVIQLSAVFLVLWGVLYFGEALSRARALGAAAAVVGVLVVNWNGTDLDVLLASDYLLGNLLVAGAAASWSLYAVGQKHLNRDRTSYETLGVVLVASAAFTLAPATPDIPSQVDWVPLAAVGYLCLNTFVGYGSFAESLKHVDASVTAVITTFAPVVTIALTPVVRSLAPSYFTTEPVTRWTLAGAALVVGGIVVVVRERPADPA
jgi:drug/metabolite transporter (DMT)-like permease